MSELQYIAVRQLCACYQVDMHLLESFAAAGLFTPTIENEEWYLEREELAELESLIRLAQDFQIDLDALDIIRHLRTQVLELREQVRFLEYRMDQQARQHQQQHLERPQQLGLLHDF